MIFRRTEPLRSYQDYTRYRPQLRSDFLYRCAYCRMPEKNFGGEANGEIDHFCPKEAFPKGLRLYKNLFWTCSECNGNKGDMWPTKAEMKVGKRFFNPCKDDDHVHWKISDDGRIESLTAVGEFTINALLLWRPRLADWRREVIAAEISVRDIRTKLRSPRLDDITRQLLVSYMKDVEEFLEPRIYDRARRKQKRN